MTKDEFAQFLDGREYLEEVDRDEEKMALDYRLLIVFGASDDLTEFRGVCHDEAGAYDGADHVIYDAGKGRWRVWDGDESAPGGIPIKAEWCPEGFDGSWRISTPLPHSTFRIMEDGDLYCQGIVISESDMLAALYP